MDRCGVRGRAGTGRGLLVAGWPASGIGGDGPPSSQRRGPHLWPGPTGVPQLGQWGRGCGIAAAMTPGM